MIRDGEREGRKVGLCRSPHHSFAALISTKRGPGNEAEDAHRPAAAGRLSALPQKQLKQLMERDRSPLHRTRGLTHAARF